MLMVTNQAYELIPGIRRTSKGVNRPMAVIITYYI